MQKMKRKIKTPILVVLALLLLTLVLFVFVPTKKQNLLSSACRIDATSCYRLIFNKKDTLYVSLCDDSLQMASTLSADVDTTVSQSGVFVSNEGDVLTSDGLVQGKAKEWSQKEVNERLCALDTLMTLRQKTNHNIMNEFDYYARTHTVVDDGYNKVMTYRELVHQRSARLDSALAIIKRALQQKSVPQVAFCLRAS